MIKEKDLEQPMLDYFTDMGYIALPRIYIGSIPDIIAIKPDYGVMNDRLNSGNSQPLVRESHFWVLDAIPGESTGNAIDITELEEKVHYSYNYLKYNILKGLEAAGYIKRIDWNSYIKIENYKSFCKELIAVELKISDWKRAVYQALMNQCFANESYIALCEKYLKRATRRIRDFETKGIGIFSISDKGEIDLILTAKNDKPTSNNRHRMLLERFWQRLINEPKKDRNNHKR